MISKLSVIIDLGILGILNNLRGLVTPTTDKLSGVYNQLCLMKFIGLLMEIRHSLRLVIPNTQGARCNVHFDLPPNLRVSILSAFLRRIQSGIMPKLNKLGGNKIKSSIPRPLV